MYKNVISLIKYMNNALIGGKRKKSKMSYETTTVNCMYTCTSKCDCFL